MEERYLENESGDAIFLGVVACPFSLSLLRSEANPALMVPGTDLEPGELSGMLLSSSFRLAKLGPEFRDPFSTLPGPAFGGQFGSWMMKGHP